MTSGEYRRGVLASQSICGSLAPPECPPGVPDEECARADYEWFGHSLEQFDCQKAFIMGIRVPGSNDRAGLAGEWRRRWEHAESSCPRPEVLPNGTVPKAADAAWKACQERVLRGKRQ